MSSEGPSADLTKEHNIPAQTQIPTNVGQKLLRAHMGQLTLLTVEWTDRQDILDTQDILDIPDKWTRGQLWWLECWPWPVGHVPCSMEKSYQRFAAERPILPTPQPPSPSDSFNCLECLQISYDGGVKIVVACGWRDRQTPPLLEDLELVPPPQKTLFLY